MNLAPGDRLRRIVLVVICLALTSVFWRIGSSGHSAYLELSELAKRIKPVDRETLTNLPKRYGWDAADLFKDPMLLELCEAISKGDSTEISRLISAGARINQPGKDGFTVLHWALACDKLPAFKQLLAAGADPDMRLEANFTFSDIWDRFRAGETVAYCCVRLWRSDFLLAALPYSDEPDQRNCHQDTLLYDLSFTGYPASLEIVDAVIAIGADLDARSPHGQTALDMACASGINKLKTALRLLEKGAQPDKCRFGIAGLRRALEKHRLRFEAEQDQEGIDGVNAVLKHLDAPSANGDG
ncbi:MAG: ankyrin repeat domain-containing protein [Fuerstiella sp.]